MNSVTPKSLADNANFQNVVEPFLEQPGLPFAEILSAKDIQHASRNETPCSPPTRSSQPGEKNLKSVIDADFPGG